jgi:hypothetical protein
MHWAIPWCLGAVVITGCGEKLAQKPNDATSGKPSGGHLSNIAATAGVEGKTPDKANAKAVQRKIIYTAGVNLVVEEFDSVPAKIDALVARFGAYVASSEITGSPGSPRRAKWTLRVPADRYDACLLAAKELDEVQNVSADSQDVSEEYYDVEARIRNTKQEEVRFLDILSTAAGKLDDVLAVERELARVRGEIEQMEGRLRVLSSLTAMSTINLDVSEVKRFVPEDAAGYGTRVRRAWETSTTALVSAVQSLSIVLIALLPWLCLYLPPVLSVVIAVRVIRRRKLASQSGLGAGKTI